MNKELILLSGNSKRNKGWIEKVESELNNLFDKTHIQYYKHWEEGKEIIDFDYELSKLIKYLKDKKDYIILAKSIGTALTVKAIKDEKINPEKCIFLGVPLVWAKEHNFDLDSWIEEFRTPTLFIQNRNDPLTNSKDLKNLLEEKSIKNYEFIELEGNTHDYNDIGKIKELVMEFLEK